jgi:hypothetical protein
VSDAPRNRQEDADPHPQSSGSMETNKFGRGGGRLGQ